MKKEHLANLADLDKLGSYLHVETIRIPKLSYLTKAKNLIRSLFSPIYGKADAELGTDDELIYTRSEGGYVAFSYTSRKNGAHRFEIYRLKCREDLEEPGFIKEIRRVSERVPKNIKQRDREAEELRKKLEELKKGRERRSRQSWYKRLKRPRSE